MMSNIFDPETLPSDQPWCDLYFASGLNVLGRHITRTASGFSVRDIIILSVNAGLPDGEDIAKDIAGALNTSFAKEDSNAPLHPQQPHPDYHCASTRLAFEMSADG